jgi:hypothetical protein
MVIRSWLNCGVWLLVALAPVLILSFRGDISRELLVGMAVLGIFGLQGLVAELLGVRLSEEGVSFPRRLVTDLPISVLWRRHIFPEEISRADMAECGLRLSLTSAEVVDIPISGVRLRDVVRFAKQFY